MAEKMEFQSEAKQVLELMINSVYSNPDIFIREQVYLVVTSAVPVETECQYKLVINPVNSVLPIEIEPNNTKNEASSVKTSSKYLYL